jgi:hypothetical protein
VRFVHRNSFPIGAHLFPVTIRKGTLAFIQPLTAMSLEFLLNVYLAGRARKVRRAGDDRLQNSHTPVTAVSPRPFDVRHVRVIYYDMRDPLGGKKLIEKVAENILSALQNAEEAILFPLKK